mgnify:CR=1 FL=1
MASAEPLLNLLVRSFKKFKLEVVLIGNAAAAIQGAPLTTLDFDFMFRDVPQNRAKLKSMAKDLKGTLLKPYYPVSSLIRLVVDDIGLQADFMATIHGVKSFAGLKKRALEIQIGKEKLLVASLDDIIKSKQAAARKHDLAALPILLKTNEALKKGKT